MTDEYIDALWVERLERNGDWSFAALARRDG